MANYYGDMADVCELAHILTVRECEKQKIKVSKGVFYSKEPQELKDVGYTVKAQKIFDYYYDLITNTLNV